MLASFMPQIRKKSWFPANFRACLSIKAFCSLLLSRRVLFLIIMHPKFYNSCWFAFFVGLSSVRDLHHLKKIFFWWYKIDATIWIICIRRSNIGVCHHFWTFFGCVRLPNRYNRRPKISFFIWRLEELGMISFFLPILLVLNSTLAKVLVIRSYIHARKINPR